MTLRDQLKQNASYDTRGAGSVDHKMKKIFEDSLRLILQREGEIKRDEASIDHIKDHIESCYRIMGYLQGMIEKEAMRATNEYYEEYITAMIKNVNSEAKLTVEEKESKRSQIEHARVGYRMLKKLAKSAIEGAGSKDFLKPEEIKRVVTKLEEIEQEEIEAVEEMRSHEKKKAQALNALMKEKQKQKKTGFLAVLDLIIDALFFKQSQKSK